MFFHETSMIESSVKLSVKTYVICKFQCQDQYAKHGNFHTICAKTRKGRDGITANHCLHGANYTHRNDIGNT